MKSLRANIQNLTFFFKIPRMAPLFTRTHAALLDRCTGERGALKERDMATKRSSFKIILGSSSVARRQILAEMGYEFTVVTADIDEKGIRKETPEELVMALAEAKADAILSKLQIKDYLDEDLPPTLLVTADTVDGYHYSIDCITLDDPCQRNSFNDFFQSMSVHSSQVVVYKGVIREKPSSKEEAREFIKGYSGSHGGVVGAVFVTNLKTGTRKGGLERAEVYFYDIPDEVIDNMIEEGISLNVAGGLMLEHPLTLPFVESVVGSTDCVMGLSKALTESLIQEVL